MNGETIRRLVRPVPPDENSAPLAVGSEWWRHYQLSLSATGLSEAAMRVVDIDSEYVVSRGILGAGHHADSASCWPATRLRRGLVMGSVQSGKTASLLAVVAKSLDQQIDVVVILAGTRIALWRQSYDRLVAQLDGWSTATDSERRTRRVLLPSPRVVAASDEMPELSLLYFETPNLARRMLLEGRPLIAVVMKNEDHLMRCSHYLHALLRATLPQSSRPLHLLVVDDEADDGSVLDKDVEAGLAPDSDGLKQIPRHVARLWSGPAAPYETLDSRLYATYLAYTATPQANFLQSDHNPLSPSDFLAALRVPYEVGSIDPPRSTTFAEPLGVSRYYAGGEMFYRRLTGQGGALCVARKYPNRSDHATPEAFEAEVKEESAILLADSLRAYFVSGAIGLLATTRRLATARGAAPAQEEAIRRLIPSPHSMLYHPSARIGDHFRAAEELAAWSGAIGPDAWPNGIPRDANGSPTLSVAGLRARLAAEEELWKAWVRAFEESRERLAFLPGGQVFPTVDEGRWPG